MDDKPSGAQKLRCAFTRGTAVLYMCSLWLILLVTFISCKFLCHIVRRLISHYKTVITLVARSKWYKGNDHYFQITGDSLCVQL